MAVGGRRSVVLAVTLLLGLATTTAVSLVLLQSVRQDAAAQFRMDAEDQADRIIEEVTRGAVVAEAARGFVLASETVTRDEFRLFVDQLSLGTRFPSAGGVGLVAIAPADAEAALVDRAAEVGQEGLTIVPAEPVGEDRYVVVFIEPEDANPGAIGFDIRANPQLREGAERALDTGEAQMTAPTSLGGGPDAEVGVVVLQPVRRPSAQSGGPLDQAFAAIVFRGDDLLAGTLTGRSDMVVEVDDVGGDGSLPANTVGVARSVGTEGVEVTRELQVERELFGRTWRITVGALGGYPVQWTTTLLTAFLGLQLTGAVGLLVWNVQRQQQRAQALADEVTADLQASEAALAQTNQALQRSNTELQHTNAELSRFAHVASHDLKEPLRMVSGFARLLETQLTDRLGAGGLTDAEQTSLTYIRRGASRMQELITDLLELATLDRTVVGRELVDVEDQLSEITEDLAGEIATVGATVRTGRLDPVNAAPRQISGLLQNLLSNALKFHRSEVSPVVEIEATAQDGIWRLEVADNGIGIAEEDREVVFDAFRRMHSREEYEGTGIGLAICASVVHAHEGTIRITDGIDGGSRFVVELPQPVTAEGSPMGRVTT